MPAHARVARRQAAAVGVERQPAAASQVALGDERTALPLGAEAAVLEQHQHGDREAVVELERVDVGRAHPRLARRPRACTVAPPRCVKSPICEMFQCVWAPAAPSTRTPGCGRSRARSFGGDQEGAAAVGDDAAVEHVERVGDHAAREHVLDAIGSRYIAFGLSPAYSRTPTAISASCSDVVPNSCMWRWATRA